MSDIELSIGDSERGVLWAFGEILSKKLTGIFSLQWPAAGREPYKKEIAFQGGEPLAVVSNRPQESFVSFLVQDQKITAEQAAEIQELAKRESKVLPDLLVAKAWIAPADLLHLMASHFAYRVFSTVALTRGQIKFRPLLQIPEKILSRDTVRLAQSFQSLFWLETKKYLNEEYCRSRFSQRSGQRLRLRGDCPISVPASDLREWNQLMREESSAENLSPSVLALSVLALEFDLVVFGESPAQKLKNEIYVLLQKVKKSNPFEILGVNEDASLDQIKKAHLQLIKKYHPDRLPADADRDLRNQAESLLASINEACSILSEPQKRENFEAERALEKMGGREAIEAQLKAEMKHDEAVLLLRRKQYRQAWAQIKDLETALKGSPAFWADFQFAKFMIEKEEKRFDSKSLPKLMKVFEEATQKDQSNTWPLFYKAMTYKILGENDKAIQAFEELLDRNPRMSEASSELRFLVMKRDKEKKDSKPKGSSWFKKS